VLEVDGKQLCQSMAIARYLSNQFNIAGENSFDKAVADMYVDGLMDLYPNFRPVIVAGMSGNEDGKKEAYAKFKSESLTQFLTRYEKFLGDNGSGFLVGKKLTWADILVAEMMNRMQELFDPSVLNGFPKMEAHMKMVHQLPNIKKYVDGRPKTTM